MARNIGIDQIDIKGVEWTNDRELNVQNALELLAGRDLDAIKPLIEKASELYKLISDLARLKQLLENMKTQTGTIASNNTGMDLTDMCPFNPNAEIGLDDEPLYYISPLLNLDPDVNGDGKIDSDDYLALFYLKYNLQNGKIENVDKLLNNNDELSGAEYQEQLKKITNEKWKEKIKELSNNFKQALIDINDNKITDDEYDRIIGKIKDFITDYDLQLVQKFIKDCNDLVKYPKKEKLENGESGEPELKIEWLPLENKEDWEWFINYINPWMSLQWPDMNNDGQVDALDASIILSISANLGAGLSTDSISIYTFDEETGGISEQPTKTEVNIEKWRGLLNATIASNVLKFASAAGAGNYSKYDINDWKDFMLREEAGL